ncbi:MAG: phenylacetic acid degradation operon negative regulatory protein PaaX [Burkholderiaceae bacterium]
MARPSTPPATRSRQLAHMLSELDVRANSMLITVFGDAIAPRRQAVWLGSLIALLAPLGLSPRLVRTSAFRLSADGWFTASREGRRSYYGLSEVGLQRVQHADRRIYEFNLPQWDGQWTLVLLDTRMRASDRLRLQRELTWESFGRLSPHVFAHPHASHAALHEIIAAAGQQGHVAVLRARGLDEFSAQPLQDIMHGTFALDRVAEAWNQFIRRFSPLQHAQVQWAPAEAFVARSLLIHEYRRVLLRDPNLPKVFLPADWPGVQARRLCEELYSGLLKASETYLRAQVQTQDGALAPTPRAITHRLSRHPAGNLPLSRP